MSPERSNAASRLLGILAAVADGDGEHKAAKGLSRAATCSSPGDTRTLARGCGVLEPIKLRCNHRLSGMGCDCAQVEARRQYLMAANRAESWLAEPGIEAWFITISIPLSVPMEDLPTNPEDRKALAESGRAGVRTLWKAWDGFKAEVEAWWGERLAMWDTYAQLGDNSAHWHVHSVILVYDRARRCAGRHRPDKHRQETARVHQEYLPRDWLIPWSDGRIAARRSADLPQDAPYLWMDKALGTGKAASSYAASYAGRGVAPELLEKADLSLWWVLAVGLRGVHLTRRSRLTEDRRYHYEPRLCPWCDRPMSVCGSTVSGHAWEEEHGVDRLSWALPKGVPLVAVPGPEGQDVWLPSVAGVLQWSPVMARVQASGGLIPEESTRYLAGSAVADQCIPVTCP